MSLTASGRVQAANGIFDSTVYISLHLSNDTELSGHGYSRKAVTSSQVTVNSSTGAISFPNNLEIYTASDASAQQAQKVAVYDASTSGNQLIAPVALTSPPAAPANGSTVRLSGGYTWSTS